MSTENNWKTICSKSDLVKDSGVCALLDNDEQIAIFQVGDDKVFAISNYDPFGKANVLYRGLIGDSRGDIYVASPLLKQRFSLMSGLCLDDMTVIVRTYSARIVEDKVEVLV